MYKAHEVKKIHYTIGEVAEKYGVATSLIRFWESEFSQLRPKRRTVTANKRVRVFREKDLAAFEKIYDLIKVEGYTLWGAKRQMELEEK